jgi:hypothetical protein
MQEYFVFEDQKSSCYSNTMLVDEIKVAHTFSKLNDKSRQSMIFYESGLYASVNGHRHQCTTKLNEIKTGE